MKLDAKDKQILNQLNQNSRLSMRELGRLIGMSSPAVAERIKQMESFGVIKGYQLQIDYEKAGYPVSCMIEATVKNGQYELFKKRIEKQTNVEYCHRIAGQACYIMKLHFERLADIEIFINNITDLAQTVTHVIFSSVDTNQKL
ncbi:Lrp/AsnC family transcriptional regulator [Pseudalkalibacillus berkeleyi]|uniref:Lrp/AsnC family transcriptional regulator n=1 Tax=Pseudalkalibacillus berkeleyi TaxID=1069813 RepID=A0ABS9GZS9_9BACL|nr:Lrp/AsnC family transcriptional regulator [Pseudalkalibacillus berkeleyi]MCF6138253.1 Lrp/AsnC family transcriptional regulator [Pseudalkalibacillus berkeleyi]